MKRNEAPEKIYLVKDKDTNKPMDYWYSSTTDDSKIEYTRTDAFIEKACDYFVPHISDNSGGYDRARIIEGFKKYMEGNV